MASMDWQWFKKERARMRLAAKWLLGIAGCVVVVWLVADHRENVIAAQQAADEAKDKPWLDCMHRIESEFEGPTDELYNRTDVGSGDWMQASYTLKGRRCMAQAECTLLASGQPRNPHLHALTVRLCMDDAKGS